MPNGDMDRPRHVTTYVAIARILCYASGAAIIGGTGRHVPQHFGWGDANVNVPPANCPFSYFVDICLMFASQIQLKIIFLCANGKSKLV